MKKFSEASYSEQREIKEWVFTWLNRYVDDIIKEVLSKADEILNNDMALTLLKELHERETEEEERTKSQISSLIDDFETWSKYSVRHRYVSHSNSYRDVLYDLYIKDIKLEKE